MSWYWKGFGEGTREEIFSFAYPRLDEALQDAYGDEGYDSYESLLPSRRAAIADAVEEEGGRTDVDETQMTEPQTELGRDVKNQTDMPTVRVDRLVRQVARKKLRRFKSRAKPS